MEAKKLWFADGKIFILSDTGKELWQSLLWYPRLLEANDAERAKYTFNTFGIRWEKLDEDISYESFEYPECEPENSIAFALKKFPEINVSQFARRIGISQSLFAAYVSGIKTPSNQRRKAIEDEFHKLGVQLTSITL